MKKEKWLLLTQHYNDGLKSVSVIQTKDFWQDVHDIYCSTNEMISEGKNYKDIKSGSIEYSGGGGGDGNFHFDAYRIESKTEINLLTMNKGKENDEKK